MAKLTVTRRDGSTSDIDAKPGLSVMQALRNGGVDEVLALCGGCCSCGTCHVYVDPDWVARLPPCGEDEGDMLEGSPHRRDNSRLSCQIRVTETLDGLRVTVAPED